MSSAALASGDTISESLAHAALAPVVFAGRSESEKRSPRAASALRLLAPPYVAGRTVTSCSAYSQPYG